MFAVVEIMGHRQRAGLISDAEFAGGKMLRIEHPSRADATGEEPLTEYYAPTSLFAIRPCTRDEAVAANRWTWDRDITRVTPELPAATVGADILDDDDESDGGQW